MYAVVYQGIHAILSITDDFEIRKEKLETSGGRMNANIGKTIVNLID